MDWNTDMSWDALTGNRFTKGLWVFDVYDSAGASTYEYSTDGIGASLFEQELNENGIEYTLKEYDSVADFIENCQEVKGNGFTDKEKIDFIIETLKALGV